MKYKTLKIINILMPLISVSLIIILWAITAHIINSEMLLPTVADTFSQLGVLLIEKSTYKAIGMSLLRSLIAFALAFIFGVGLAILSSMCKPLKTFLNPIIVLFRAIPTMAVILLTLVWMTSYETPILVAFIVIFPLIYGGYLSSIEGIDENILFMANIYKVPLRKKITKIYIPETTIGLLNIVQNTIGFTVKIVIAAEVIGLTKNSIGNAMNSSKLYLDIALLLAWTIIAVLIAGILELIIWSIKKYYIWRKQ